MADGFDAIYLSPHLDDAALSCGGQIQGRTARGERVLVASFFTADVPAGAALSGFAQRQLGAWHVDRDNAMAARRREDIAACRTLGAEPMHLGLLDAIFRQHGARPRHTRWRSILEGRAHSEQDTLAAVAGALESLPAARFVAAPLGAGHVDHRLLRSAAETVLGRSLVLYEDLPYALAMIRRRRALGWLRRGIRSETCRVSAAARAAKLESLNHYTSQDAAGALVPAAERGLSARGGERLWRRD